MDLWWFYFGVAFIDCRCVVCVRVFFVLVLFRIVARDLLSLQVLVLMLRSCFVLSLFFLWRSNCDRIVFFGGRRI